MTTTDNLHIESRVREHSVEAVRADGQLGFLIVIVSRCARTLHETGETVRKLTQRYRTSSRIFQRHLHSLFAKESRDKAVSTVLLYSMTTSEHTSRPDIAH